MASPDPFTQVHQAIWSALKLSPAWSAIVPAGNIIDVTQPQPLSIKPRTGLPQDDNHAVRILQTSWNGNPWDCTSTVAEFVQGFSIELTTNSLAIIALNQFKFLTLAALTNAGPDLGLTRAANPLFASCQWTATGNAKDTYADPQSKVKEWETIMMIGVHFGVSRRTLQAISLNNF